MERRLFATELRAVPNDTNKRTIGGYAAVFNRLSVVIWGFREEIAPGAFADSLDSDIRALWNHDMAAVIGRTTNGSLRLEEDNIGLAFELDLPDTQIGRDAYTLVDGGYVSQMSFGFKLLPDGDEWRFGDGDQIIHRLKKVELREISPVTFPAYPDTTVDARTRALWGDETQMPETVRRAARQLGVDSAELVARARTQAAIDLDLYLATLGIAQGKR